MDDMLPGFTPATTGNEPGPLTQAAAHTIAALTRAQLVEDRHALTVQLVTSLAQAVDRGLTAPKVSVATATLSKHLLEAAASLPQPAEAAAGADWDAFTARLAAAAAVTPDQ